MGMINDYSKNRDQELGSMLGVCMRNMWIAYCIMTTGWLLIMAAGGRYEDGMFAEYAIPLFAAWLLCFIYQKLLMHRVRLLKQWLVHLLLYLYLIILLMHPSKMALLDGLAFGVIAMYPVWTERRWGMWQTLLLAVVIILRHRMIPLAVYGETVDLVNVLAIGLLVYLNIDYVHHQTMLLGDATRMDAATGLYNHESFYEELESRMKDFEQSSCREDMIFCLFIADIDNFKKVNDTYGHAFGDQVLLGLADLFKNYCGERDFSARYGGEEFVMILGECSKKEALNRANMLRKEFSNMIFTDQTGMAHQFTISIGVAEYSAPWDTASQFFDQSDQALYQAKNTGKNRVCSS